jgi:hypothetical protein
MIHVFGQNQVQELSHLLKTWVSELPKDTIPIIIPVFNNPTYLKQMLTQLSILNLNEVWIIDNGSTYRPMKKLLSANSKKYKIISIHDNPGPRFLITEPNLVSVLPSFFIYTDPDIKFSENLPKNFIEIFMMLSEKYRIGKVGFALEITPINLLRSVQIEILNKKYHIWEWENQFWSVKIADAYPLEVYRALIDTTFSFYNMKHYDYKDFTNALRVAGDFTSQHLPWYKVSLVPSRELNFYKKNQKHSYYGLGN